MTEIKEKMKELNIKQVDLLFLLRERGIDIQQSSLSSIIRGVDTYPKAVSTAKVIWEILEDVERRTDRAISS